VSSDRARVSRSTWSPSPRPGEAIVSYSQNAEDVRLARAFDSNLGFYVDVGAHDPTQFSVTKMFYDRGWSGINIEPGPGFERLEQERPRDVNLNVAVALESAVRDFWVSEPDSGLSTLSPPDATAKLPPGFSFARRTVETKPLSAILNEYAEGRAVDFMTVDVEGTEADVIRSMDFRVSRPVVLIVEAVTPLSYEPSHDAWHSLLTDAGYEFAVFDGLNRFYVERDHRELIEPLSYPVSAALDGYVTYESMRQADAVAHLTKDNERLTDAVAHLTKDGERLADTVAHLTKDGERLAAELTQLGGDNESLRAQLVAVQQSWSWRITRSLRVIKRSIAP
jgi:FkbM family methyltransferase